MLPCYKRELVCFFSILILPNLLIKFHRDEPSLTQRQLLLMLKKIVLGEFRSRRVFTGSTGFRNTSIFGRAKKCKIKTHSVSLLDGHSIVHYISLFGIFITHSILITHIIPNGRSDPIHVFSYTSINGRFLVFVVVALFAVSYSNQSDSKPIVYCQCC